MEEIKNWWGGFRLFRRTAVVSGPLKRLCQRKDLAWTLQKSLTFLLLMDGCLAGLTLMGYLCVCYEILEALSLVQL